MKRKYYLGLDIGTDSVGYAVTDENYALLKFKGKAMWGATLFESAQISADRRAFRTARRRLDRRQQRIALLEELFANEIANVDPRFFIRRKESALLRTDVSSPADKSLIFNDPDFSDRDYYKHYPTIHHLLVELMQSDEPHDVRLVFTALAWLVAHRGHFLSEIDAGNIENVRDFHPVYQSLLESLLEIADGEIPWECSEDAFADILSKRVGVTAKEKQFTALLFNGTKPKDTNENGYPVDRAILLKLLCGGKVKASALFKNEEYDEFESFSLDADEETLLKAIAPLGDDAGLILRLKAMYDWALLVDTLAGKSSISEAKVSVYEQHHTDLVGLKAFIKKYRKSEYSRIFRTPVENNYVFYSGNFRSVPCGKRPESFAKPKKAEDFSKFIKNIVKQIDPEACDLSFYTDMLARLDLNAFLPKQVTGDNRVIPYQLYLYELNKILEKASGYLPFLSESDADGLSVADKVRSIFLFRVPYFVGPLNKHSNNSWFVRKAEGRILPWNIESLVDYEASEQCFIDRMTNYCTYLPGENVLPKCSLLYTKFTVLNEINNLKINSVPISVEAKQMLFSELFMKKTRVTPKAIENALLSNGCMKKGDVLTGIDITVKASYKPYLDFAPLFKKDILTAADAETIIERRTYTEDKQRYVRWLSAKYPHLKGEDFKRISGLKYADFGRLSAKLLNGIEGVCRDTGEAGTIMHFLWETNNNLMELLSERFTFAETIKAFSDAYYAAHPMDINTWLDEMYVSNAVKRPIFRTLDIVKEVKKAMGSAPEKIFIEMARGATEEQKNKRTKTRRDQLLELYQKIKTDDARLFAKALEDMGDSADSALQSEALFLYYLQMGKCAYTGEQIEISQLKTNLYNIDHIWPQCFIKDDSILNNKVLVVSTANGNKGDHYPVPEEYRHKMQSLWQVWHENGLMSDEKYRRLTRTTPFTDDEKMGFISRQLVETRQSTKAVAGLLQNYFPNTEIVFVKAGLASDFRHEFGCVKCREINDLHHAKDAYLNIVVGNVYHERFSRRWFSLQEKYSIKTATLFTRPLTLNGKNIWNGCSDKDRIVKTLSRNDIHLTRFAFMRKGGFFDQMPITAGTGLVPRKKGLDPESYGGYRKTTASFYMLARYTQGKKRDAMFVPVELLATAKVINDTVFAAAYVTNQIESITGKPVKELDFPLGLRALKVNTVFEFDGFRACLAGKSGGGKDLLLASLMPLFLSPENEHYIKKLSSFSEKKKQHPAMTISERFDGITPSENLALYRSILSKLEEPPYSTLSCIGGQAEVLKKGEEKFIALKPEEQVNCLLQCVLLLKDLRAGGCDMHTIGGVAKAAVLTASSKISNWKKYSYLSIIDTSAAGLYEKRSVDLLTLI